jgi:Sulfatase
VLVPPALLAGVEAAATLAGSRAAEGLHLALVAALVGLVVLQALRRAADPAAAVALPAAALAGAGAAYAYARLAPVRSFLTVLAPAPIVFLLLFLFVSPVGKLVLPTTPEALAAQVSSETPVVMLVFDELATASLLDERSEIDAARYPNFAALARESTWFRNAATVDAWTVNAVPALLTGIYPEHGRLPVYSEHPNNLFTLLGNRYRLLVSESLTELCPRELCPHASESFARRMEGLFADAGVVYLHRTLPRDLRAGLPAVSGTWGAFLESAHEQTRSRLELFRDFLSSLRAGQRPFLAYVHLMFPHIPWEYLPSGKRYQGDTGEVPGFETTRWGDDPFLVDQAHQRYLLQLGFTDRLLGELLARLRATGLYDRVLLIVLADHGASFRPGDRRRAFTHTNLEDVAFAPLFVKTPGQKAGHIEDASVQTVDVLPTIANVLDIDVPWQMDGTSLLTPRARERYILIGDREMFTPQAEALIARRTAALRDRLSLLGSGAEAPGLFGLGPNRELLGREVAALELGEPGTTSAEIDQEDELRAVDLAAEYVPARLTGRISGEDGEAPRDLAVSVNGRIAAVARSFVFEGEERVSVLVPEPALRSGANDVELYWVRSGPVLRPLWSN